MNDLEYIGRIKEENFYYSYEKVAKISHQKC